MWGDTLRCMHLDYTLTVVFHVGIEDIHPVWIRMRGESEGQ